eukprot:maker-scaffold34_size539781-snap-gene-4.25 protein:Tk05373 transcript:maker-scaffold34_size539781-snap-gene-4.25-mRNA-1 annotation:"sodium-potassium-chloride cotransporter "
MSGDLKDPAVAIPKGKPFKDPFQSNTCSPPEIPSGTLSAVILTYVSYVGYAIMIGSCYLSEASGDAAEYNAFLNDNATLEVFSFNNCTFRKCEYGTSNDQQTLSKISYTSYLVYAGCFAATLSSAIASLVGAPRVLQALAKDKLYPFIGVFSSGHGKNNEPFRGYILSFCIALACVMVGNLDVVSSLLSNFFVAAYALINFSVFHASMVKSPGWRPAFRYYNEWVSLAGTFLCVAVMFLMDTMTAFITIAVVGILYFYIRYRKPEAHWGSSTEAQQFMNTLENVYDLSLTPDHVKNYRPKIMVFSGNPSHRVPLMDFAHLLTKKLSLLMCADIREDVTIKEKDSIKADANEWLVKHKMKAFHYVAYEKNFEDGAMSCMNLAGLGKFAPNMILMGFKTDWLDDEMGTERYYNILHQALDMNLSLTILRLPRGCDFSQHVQHECIVEVEVTNDEEDDLCYDEDDDEDLDTGMTLKISSILGDKLKKSRQRHRSKRRSVFTGQNGVAVPQVILDDLNVFKQKKKLGVIDVWWLYDDGGLTLLLPVILKMRKQFANCQLRVFALGSTVDDLDSETKNMTSLLEKFRIDYEDVVIIPDVTTEASEATQTDFLDISSKAGITTDMLIENQERSNRYLRLSESLKEYSTNSQMVVMTLPMPRPSMISSGIYMSWLEIMTKDLDTPFLFVRGNQSSVLTFYS